MTDDTRFLLGAATPLPAGVERTPEQLQGRMPPHLLPLMHPTDLTPAEKQEAVQAIIMRAFEQVKRYMPDHAPFVMMCTDDVQHTVVITPLELDDVAERFTAAIPEAVLAKYIPAVHAKAKLVAAVRHAFKYIPETTGATARRMLTEALTDTSAHSDQDTVLRAKAMFEAQAMSAGMELLPWNELPQHVRDHWLNMAKRGA